jgi:hypothetical protein
VTGRLIVKLWASSSAPDTDFTAKLVDVYPPNHDFPGGVDLNVGESAPNHTPRAITQTEPPSQDLLREGGPGFFVQCRDVCLPGYFGRNLHNAIVNGCAADCSRGRGIQRGCRRGKLGMVEDIKGFGAQFEVGVLMDGQRE